MSLNAINVTTYWGFHQATPESRKHQAGVQHANVHGIIKQDPGHNEWHIHHNHGALSAQWLGDIAWHETTQWNTDQVDATCNTIQACATVHYFWNLNIYH